MTAVRRDVTTSTEARQAYVEGVLRLAAEPSGLTTRQVNEQLGPRLPGFRIRGLDQPLMTWDLFVLWHQVTMSLPTTPPRPLRNQAHGGPVFLPWHRLFLIRLEEQLQRVLDDPDVGLPYWDWAADGALPPEQQSSAALWQDDLLGTPQGQVVTGALGELRVRLDGFQAQLWSVAPRPVVRAAGTDTPRLPSPDDVAWALGAPDDDAYDESPWDATSPGFRNRLEGWRARPDAPGPQLHNRVHVWVGGDMSVGTSPNDPVFYLNHCTVDRLWEVWMARHGRGYRPVAGDPRAPQGQRLDDPLTALLGAPMSAAELLDPSPWYGYDNLEI